MAKSNVMVTIKDLHKSFKNKHVLKGINLQVKKGETVALVGANGAGKTTLIETILGINKPNKGSIAFGFEYKRSPLEKIGVQFQDSNYPEGLTAYDILQFFMNVAKHHMSQAKVDEIIAAFQMGDFMHSRALSLSGGQRQKLNIVLAFISQPELIFLDELTTGLDIKVRHVITSFVDKYIRETAATLVVVSHNAAEIEWLCKRIIAMQDGEIRYDNSVVAAKAEFGDIDKMMSSFI